MHEKNIGFFYHDAVNSDKFYNLASGGDGGRTCYGETHHALKESLPV